MLDNRFALLFIRGERPVKDLKYDIMRHPNISYTTDGGAQPYQHGEDMISIASISFEPGLITEAEIMESKNRDYLIFTEEELEEMLKKKREGTENEKKKQ